MGLWSQNDDNSEDRESEGIGEGNIGDTWFSSETAPIAKSPSASSAGPVQLRSGVVTFAGVQGGSSPSIVILGEELCRDVAQGLGYVELQHVLYLLALLSEQGMCLA